MKEKTTYSYWLVLLLGGGFAFIVTDVLADYILRGEGRLATTMLQLALFLPIFWTVNQFALRLQQGADKRT